MVMLTSRRCRSVPPTVVEVNYDYGLGSRKAQRIANYLADDHDTLRAASRRQDAALLRDITSRMDASCDYRPPTTRRSRARSPVTCHVARPVRARSVPPCFRHTEYDEELYEPFEPRPRTRLLAEDYEPYFYKPITSYVSHQARYRTGSEPPVDRNMRNAYSLPAYNYRTTPSTDLAVRQARCALGRLERELSSGWEDPYYEYADEYVHAPVRPYRQATYAGVTSLPYRSYSPTRVYSPTLHRRGRDLEVESRLESMMMPDLSSAYSSIRSRTADARSKVDAHKVMMDRYLPVNLGPEREVGWHHRRLRGDLPCLMPGSVPGRFYVRRSTIPSTSVTRLLASRGPDLIDHPGFVKHLLRTRLPSYITAECGPSHYLGRRQLLPLTFFMQ